MDTKQFDRQVSDLAAALGDTTRRGIYIAVREAAEPVTVSEIADLFGIHANVARHHLDHLVADGYLQVSHKRPGGRSGPGAGRPAKHYEPTAKDISVQFPARRYDLLAELLIRMVAKIAPEDPGGIAEEVGREYGRELAAELGIGDTEEYEAAARAVAKAMTGVGFDMEAEPGEKRMVTRHCPFGVTADNHPDIVCRLDQGLVSGLLEQANQEPMAIVSPHALDDDACLTEI